MSENLDPNVLAAMLDGKEAAKHFDQLVEIGMRPSAIAERMESAGLADHAEAILADGFDSIRLVSRLRQEDLDRCIVPLLYGGFDATTLAGLVSGRALNEYIKLFRAFEADAEIIELRRYLDLSPEQIMSFLPYNKFYTGGYPEHVTERQLLRGMGRARVAARYKELIQLGIDINAIVRMLEPEDLAELAGDLVYHGASIEEIVSHLPVQLQLEYYEELTELGAKLDSDKLLRYAKKHGGVGPISVVAILDMDSGGEHLDALEALCNQCVKWYDDVEYPWNEEEEI